MKVSNYTKSKDSGEYRTETFNRILNNDTSLWTNALKKFYLRTNYTEIIEFYAI